MRNTETKMVEIKVTTYSCDFCNYFTTNNSSYCGKQPVEICDCCGKDVCWKCLTSFSDDWSDYPDMIISCPECLEVVTKSWEEADESQLYIFESIPNLTRNILARKEHG